MGRLLALRPEILARFDYAAPEILFPNAVDCNPCCERIVLAHKPLSEPQAVRRRFGRKTAEHSRHSAVYFVALTCESSAYADEVGGTFDAWLFTHDQRGRDTETVYLFLQFFDTFADRFEFRRSGTKLFGKLFAFFCGAILRRLRQNRALPGTNFYNFRRISRVGHGETEVANRLSDEIRILNNRDP